MQENNAYLIYSFQRDGQTMPARKQAFIDRFWAKVAKAADDECWMWTANTVGGYGRMTVDRAGVLAHRLSWEIAHGPIPDGLQVLHRCDHPGCVNPAHLFLGTRAENMADKRSKGRAAQGAAMSAAVIAGHARRFQAEAVAVIAAEIAEAERPSIANLPAVVEPATVDAEFREVAPGLPAQADSDHDMVELWIRRYESSHTRRKYRAQAERFLAHVDRPLAAVRLGDVQGYAASLDGLASASRANALAAVKSLLSFAQEVGYLRFNVGKAVKLPAVKETLAERIMEEADAMRLVALEPDPRNRALLTLLYGAGLRVSELCALRWRDLAPRDTAGQVTTMGKGGKTRAVLLSANTWRALQAIRGEAGPDAPVFLSRKGGHLDPASAWRIVKAAAARAGLPAGVSPHWLRHAHASHSLDRGAPLSLVKDTLGHASVATTGRYLHARPNDSSSRFLGV